MLFVQKYAPKKIDELAGNEEARTKLKQWMLNWLRGIKQKPILLYGPPGIGKTTAAYAIRDEFNLELIEMNSSDFRNAERIEQVLSAASNSLSLSGKNKLLLIDDVDVLTREDRGGVAAIARLLENAQVPILLTASDFWDRKIAPLRLLCHAVELRRISKSTIAKVLRKIADEEKIAIDNAEIAAIAENSNGDLRSAINDLQVGASGMRDREKDMFERMRIIFKAMSYSEAREASWGDIDHDLLKLWVDENIPLEYETKQDISTAYNWLSRADMFDGRIVNRQYWGFLRYSNDLLTAGIALSKAQKYYKFVRYSFPSYLRVMSALSARRAMLKEIGKKIGSYTHVGWKDALSYLHIIKHILNHNPEARDFYQFDDEEVAFILEIPVGQIEEHFSRIKSGRIKSEREKEEQKPAKEKTAKEEKIKEKKSILHDFF